MKHCANFDTTKKANGLTGELGLLVNFCIWRFGKGNLVDGLAWQCGLMWKPKMFSGSYLAPLLTPDETLELLEESW